MPQARHKQPPRPIGSLPDLVKDVSFRAELEKDEIAGENRYANQNEVDKARRDYAGKKGQYKINNNMLAYVDKTGEILCVPFRLFHAEHIGEPDYIEPNIHGRVVAKYGQAGVNVVNALKNAGYKEGGTDFWVPHSNDGGGWAEDKLKEIARWESIAEGGNYMKITEQRLRELTVVPNSREIPSTEIADRPENLGIGNPVVEYLQLQKLMGREIEGIALAADPNGPVNERLKRQLVFFRDQIRPRLTEEPADLFAVEVINRCFPGLGNGFIEKFVLDRDGNTAKIVCEMDSLRRNTHHTTKIVLTPDNQLHIEIPPLA